MAAIGGLIGNPLATLVAAAVGGATGESLRPELQHLVNELWPLNAVRPPDAFTLAGGVAQGQVDRTWAEARAAEQGFSADAFGRMVDMADVGPGSGFAFELWRRGLIDDGGFGRALKRLGIEDEWIGPLRGLRNRLLTPDQLANARQRGFIQQAEQYAEAALQGVTNARAEIEFELSGLPPPPDRARDMWRRGIIGETEFRQAIVEGNEKIKYVDEEVALFHPLLTPAQIVNQRLRGWRDTAWMNARLAEHGFSAEQANDLFEGQGRPISFHQVFIGSRRGGVYDGPTGALDAPFLKSLQESNIRPEWYNLAWAQRNALPSAFVIRGLSQSGDIDGSTTRRLLEWLGWPEFLIDPVVASWTGGTTTGASALVKSARTQAVTEIRNAYLIGQADESQARGWLGAIGVTAADQDGLLPIWGVMREVPQKGLTAAQIVRAYKKLPAQWPRSRALDELQLLGLTADDAATLLDE